MDVGAIERLGERMRHSGAQEASVAKEVDEKAVERQARIEREIEPRSRSRPRLRDRVGSTVRLPALYGNASLLTRAKIRRESAALDHYPCIEPNFERCRQHSHGSRLQDIEGPFAAEMLGIKTH